MPSPEPEESALTQSTDRPERPTDGDGATTVTNLDATLPSSSEVWSHPLTPGRKRNKRQIRFALPKSTG